jgi:two-component system, NarL family, nitrate/nitrite response regulator NarL
MTPSSLPAVTSSRPMHPIRILIADCNPMSSQLLAESLERDARFEVVAVAEPNDLLLKAASRNPDVAVISAEFEGGSRKGMQIARALNARYPSIYIVMLLAANQRDAVVASFRNGARGIFCRAEPLSEFRKCLERVGGGQIWASNVESGYLLEVVKSTPSCDGVDQVGALSKREVAVAEAAAQGFTNKQIADQLGLSEHTVKNYLFRVFEKLRVSNRIELLFLLEHNNLNKRAIQAPSAGEGQPIDAYVKAAEEGFVVAQFIVGLAYLDGCELGKSEHSAYYWLRMTEQNSLQVLQRSRVLIDKLKDCMKLQDIDTIERRLATTVGNDKPLVSKRPIELVRQSVNLLSRMKE